MQMLVPRLLVSDRTAEALRRMAHQRGVGVGDVIAAILETRLAAEPKPPDEILNRIILVGERFGLGVGVSDTYPADWATTGGLAPEDCRRVAADYVAWRRRRNEHPRRDTQGPGIP